MKNIVLLGDLAFTGLHITQSENNEERVSNVIPILTDAELVFANLEIPVKVDEVTNENKEFVHFSQSKPTTDLLNLLNIGCVSLANNHIYDCKMSGLQETIRILDSAGIQHTGAGWTPEHIDPVIIDKGNFRLGFMAYVDKSTNPRTENFQELYINYFSLEGVKRDIGKIRNKVDKLICSIHWGVDYSYYPTKNQVNVAHELINNGIDIIMGHHPHTLQPYEIYNDGVIFYSLGGLTFGDFERNGKMHALFRKTKKGVIAECNIRTMKLAFTTTKELIGNYLKIEARDYNKWSARKWKLYYKKESKSFINILIQLEENVIYRIYEYFFGYYQSPIKRLFQFSNLRKLKKLFSSINR